MVTPIDRSLDLPVFVAAATGGMGVSGTARGTRAHPFFKMRRSRQVGAHLSTKIAGLGCPEVRDTSGTHRHAQRSRPHPLSHAGDFHLEDERCTRRSPFAPTTRTLLSETFAARRYRRLRHVIARRSTAFRARAFGEQVAVALLAVLGLIVNAVRVHDRGVAPIAGTAAVIVSAHREA